MAEVAARDADAVMAEVRELALARIASDAADVDRESRFPTENLEGLAAVGALGLLVAPEDGGAGGGLSSLARACEESAGLARRRGWCS